MKKTSKPRYVIIPVMVLLFVAIVWSCKDDDPTLQDLRNDKIAYLGDSLRISDSLKRINAAGIVNYSITVVSGSTSSIFSQPGYNLRTSATNATKAAVAGAVVTISQFGKILKDTTDESGLVVFNGFFRNAVNVTVEKEGFTSVSYISAVGAQAETNTGSISFVGNLIPIFELTGDNAAVISGRATIQTNLTNTTRETVPDGTTFTAAIDASADSEFSRRFLTSDLANVADCQECAPFTMFVGMILQASYSTGIIGTTAAGAYTITVPAAIDGLPLKLQYSDIAADQTLFVPEGWPTIQTPGDRTSTYRNIFSSSMTPSPVPSGANVSVDFESFDSPASAMAIVSPTTGTIAAIQVTAGGSGYKGAPLVEITGDGTGATATATVAGGVVTGITIINAGAGYTSAPSVNLIYGNNLSGAPDGVTSTLDGTGSVFSIVVGAQGTGYTSAPTVTFTGGGGTGATATAVIANGRVVSVNITAAGSGYTGAPTIGFTGGGGSGATATAAVGFTVAQVNVTGGGIGANHVYAPAVTFSAPNFSNGTPAQGVAIINTATRQVSGVQVTNPGTGYTSAPTVTLTAYSIAATASAALTGGAVVAVNVQAGGSNYAYAPTVKFSNDGGGSGAAGTAVMQDGKVISVTITSGGTGYTGAPTVELLAGDGATGYVTVTNGAITAITVSDGGHGYTGAPRVVLDNDGDATGGGATATATVAGGQLTGITVTAGGTGYLEGNTPGSSVGFSATKGVSDGVTTLETKPGIKYINDVYYGTGFRTTP